MMMTYEIWEIMYYAFFLSYLQFINQYQLKLLVSNFYIGLSLKNYFTIIFQCSGFCPRLQKQEKDIRDTEGHNNVVGISCPDLSLFYSQKSTLYKEGILPQDRRPMFYRIQYMDLRQGITIHGYYYYLIDLFHVQFVCNIACLLDIVAFILCATSSLYSPNIYGHADFHVVQGIVKGRYYYNKNYCPISCILSIPVLFVGSCHFC